jgi:uncharacterized membrane protein (UPF0127 family)
LSCADGATSALELILPRALSASPFGSLLMVAFAIISLAAGSSHARAQAALEAIEVVTASGTHPFSVEVMRTPEQLEKGLMFRRYMPEDRGMLFDFKTEQPVTFWMKNTYLPLDMIFISKAGKIVSIAENAEPLSEKLIPAGAPVQGVLEVNAGTAARIQAKPGDSVRASIFGK